MKLQGRGAQGHVGRVWLPTKSSDITSVEFERPAIDAGEAFTDRMFDNAAQFTGALDLNGNLAADESLNFRFV